MHSPKYVSVLPFEETCSGFLLLSSWIFIRVTGRLTLWWRRSLSERGSCCVASFTTIAYLEWTRPVCQGDLRSRRSALFGSLDGEMVGNSLETMSLATLESLLWISRVARIPTASDRFAAVKATWGFLSFSSVDCRFLFPSKSRAVWIQAARLICERGFYYLILDLYFTEVLKGEYRACVVVRLQSSAVINY